MPPTPPALCSDCGIRSLTPPLLCIGRNQPHHRGFRYQKVCQHKFSCFIFFNNSPDSVLATPLTTTLSVQDIFGDSTSHPKKLSPSILSVISLRSLIRLNRLSFCRKSCPLPLKSFYSVPVPAVRRDSTRLHANPILNKLIKLAQTNSVANAVNLKHCHLLKIVPGDALLLIIASHLRSSCSIQLLQPSLSQWPRHLPRFVLGLF